MIGSRIPPPPNQTTLYHTLQSLQRTMGTNPSSGSSLTTSTLAQLIHGLTSTLYVQEYYTAYSTLLKFEPASLSASDLLNLINKILSSKPGGSGSGSTTTTKATKQEKRLLTIARLFALAGLIRSGKLNGAKDTRIVLTELVGYLGRKGTVVELSTAFMLSLLENSTPEQRQEPEFVQLLEEGLQSLKNNKLKLQILLKCKELGLEGVNYEFMTDLDNVIEVVTSQRKFDYVGGVPSTTAGAGAGAEGGDDSDDEGDDDKKSKGKANTGAEEEEDVDAEWLLSLHSYLTSARLTNEYWSALIPKLRPCHVTMLAANIHAAMSIQQQTPSSVLAQLLCTPDRSLIVYLLEIFRKENPLLHHSAKVGFSYLLDWKSEEGDSEAGTGAAAAMSRKQRKTALHNLFEGSPNVLIKYRYLAWQLSTFFQQLTGKELDHVAKICLQQLTSATGGEHANIQLGLSILGCLAKIGMMKSTPTSTKLSVMDSVFKEAFCESTTLGPDDPKAELLHRAAKSSFLKLLNLGLTNTELLDELFANIYGIITGKNPDWTCKAPPSATLLKYWKKAKKSTINNPTLVTCLKLHCILSLIESPGLASAAETEPDQEKEYEALAELLGICKSTAAQNEQLVKFILKSYLLQRSSASASSASACINYEPLLKAILGDGDVELLGQVIPIITGVLDPESDEGLGDDDEDEDDDMDDSEEDQEEDEEMMELDDDDDSDQEEIPAMKNGSSSKSSSAAKPKNKPKSVDNGSDDDDDEESIDLDSVTPEELAKMDAAISNVFNVKQRVKDSKAMEIKAFMRACSCLELCLKVQRTTPSATIIPIILMPIVHYLTTRSTSGAGLVGSSNKECMTRATKVLRRIAKYKKLDSAEDVEPEIVNEMMTEIRTGLNAMSGAGGKKAANKGLKKGLIEVMKMIEKCYGPRTTRA